MHAPRLLSFFMVSGFLLALAASLRADTIETRNGARLVGVVKSVGGGKIVLQTDYAGAITVSQKEVVRLEIDRPQMVRLEGGALLEGAVSADAEAGKVVVTGADGARTETRDKVAATWAPGAVDPAVAARMRRWKYEVNFDISGKTGNREQLRYGGGAKARLAGPEDTLVLYSDFSYNSVNDRKSEDKLRAGVDYSSYVTKRTTWYARDEGGYDNVKDIAFYNVAATGFGYDFIQRMPKWKLTGRVGLSHRYEDYRSPLEEDVGSVGLDLGASNHYRFSNAVMNNSITYVPAFEQFANFRSVHDSNLEFPLGGRWKFRIGVSHDYTSETAPRVAKLDTTYYGKFVLNWE